MYSRSKGTTDYFGMQGMKHMLKTHASLGKFCSAPTWPPPKVGNTMAPKPFKQFQKAIILHAFGGVLVVVAAP